MSDQALLTNIRNALPWVLPFKLVLTAVLSVLGGAGLLGYLSEYATYSYAIHFGFRPPLEGIPYLKATIALGSVALLISGALFFAFWIFVMKLYVWQTEYFLSSALSMLKRVPNSEGLQRSFDFSNVISRLQASHKWKVALIGISGFAAFWLIGYLAAHTLFASAGDFPIYFGLGMASVAFMVIVALANPNVIWWLAGILTIGYFFLWLVALFTPTDYSVFLRVVGYGGGIPVNVELRDSAQKNAKPETLYLMLRTTDALILLSESGTTFIEIPRDQIKRITHGYGGLGSLPYRMPARLSPTGIVEAVTAH
jgi:hypothetical protein